MGYKLCTFRWQEKGVAEYWHGVAFADFLNLTQYETILPVILQYLPKHGKILDAGCGPGRWLIYLHNLGYDVTGLDISEEALDMAQNYNKSIQLVRGDVEHTLFSDETFDVIISFGVAEHFEKGPQTVLRESHRLLTKDGMLMLTVPYHSLVRKMFFSPAYWILRKILVKLGFQPVFFEYRFSRDEMISILKESKFEVLCVEPVDFKYPKSMGLYADWGKLIGSKNKAFELNILGKIVQLFLGLFPLWLYCEGILLIARKK
jgi:2-polyprenyl-3-methyl-5-hydroxy-6-metoxy-1,4-benzoquinol methylase